jgi:hypothetical protein
MVTVPDVSIGRYKLDLYGRPFVRTMPLLFMVLLFVNTVRDSRHDIIGEMVSEVFYIL